MLRRVKSDRPRLATVLANAFELLAGVAILALVGAALVIFFAPASTHSRAALAFVVGWMGAMLAALAILLGRHTTRMTSRPWEVLETALDAARHGDRSVRVPSEHAIPEVESVFASFNTLLADLEGRDGRSSGRS